MSTTRYTADTVASTLRVWSATPSERDRLEYGRMLVDCRLLLKAPDDEREPVLSAVANLCNGLAHCGPIMGFEIVYCVARKCAKTGRA